MRPYAGIASCSVVPDAAKAAAESGGFAERFDFAENLGESGAGNDAVLHDVTGGNAAHGSERSFTAFPD